MKTKEISARIFLIFATLLALLISISGTLSISKTQDIVFQLLFLPVTLFFVFETIQTFFFSKKSVSETLIAGKKKIFAGILIFLAIIFTIKAVSIFQNKKNEIPQTIKEEIVQVRESPLPTPTPAGTTPFVRIKTKNPQTEVNLREKPTTSSAIIKKLRSGKTYPLLSEKNGWYEIRVEENLSGWVLGEYIEIEK